jgi:hypothetical protein
MAFKVLHCLLVFLRRSLCLEGTEISSLTRLRIFLAGIQPVFAGFEFPDHDSIGYSQMKSTPRVELQGNRLGCRIKTGRRSACPAKA